MVAYDLRTDRSSKAAHRKTRSPRRCDPSAPESAHQQRGESPRRTEHWLSVAEGNCVVERRGGEQPEANNQSIIKKMMNSIRPDALASLLGKGEAQDGSRPGKGERQIRDLACGEHSERRTEFLTLCLSAQEAARKKNGTRIQTEQSELFLPR
jgi:hypothetical protein